ncbi:MAG: acyl carrier protein [Kiritimatiellae bacterium]|nr:acyl carrier protein [Kiritimatiellia bacterium]
MDRTEVYSRLKGVFADVFDREVELKDETTAADVPGWDSLTHITLIGAVEDEFDVKFAMKDVVGMKNVGEMVDKIIELADE